MVSPSLEYGVYTDAMEMLRKRISVGRGFSKNPHYIWGACEGEWARDEWLTERVAWRIYNGS